MNISKEVKFVKAKEPIGVTPTVEMTKVKKKKNVANQRVLNKPCNQFVVRFEAKAKSLPRLQKILEQTMCVITANFKGTHNPIVIG